MNTDYTIDDCVLIDVPTFTDDRGTLSALDKELPFQVKRIFWLYNINDGKERGAHALLESTEIMIAIHGSFDVLLDDGKNRKVITLNDAGKGLLIRPGIWFKTSDYVNDGISLILASDEYSRGEYTYSYEDYLRMRKE